MVLETNNIRSIGWLENTGNTVTLTPVFSGEQMPRSVVVTREEFATVRGDKLKMKQIAVEKLNA